MEKKLIGYVCEKGNHLALIGEDLSCGSHFYAEVYVSVERMHHEDGTPYGRGQDPSLDEIAAGIQRIAAFHEANAWSVL